MIRFSLPGGRLEGFCALDAFPAIAAPCHFDIKHLILNALLIYVLGLFFLTLRKVKENVRAILVSVQSTSKCTHLVYPNGFLTIYNNSHGRRDLTNIHTY